MDRTSRGIAILISNAADIKVRSLLRVSGNILHLSFEWHGEIAHLINVYVPSDDTSSPCFSDLCAYILRLNHANVILLGDFNAHVGYSDKTASDCPYIGNNLLHSTSNDNGVDIKNLIHMTKFKLRSSFEASKSLLTTWSSGNKVSHIDHILFSPVTSLIPLHMSTSWTKVRSDHKLLVCCVKLSKSAALQYCLRQTTALSRNSDIKAAPSLRDLQGKANDFPGKRRRGSYTSDLPPQLGALKKAKATHDVNCGSPVKDQKWNVDNLSNKRQRESYESDLQSQMGAFKKAKVACASVSDKWAHISTCIKQAASRQLNNAKSPITPKRNSALGNFQKSKFKHLKNPTECCLPGSSGKKGGRLLQ